MTDQRELMLDPDAVAIVRRALLLGLYCLGEVERAQNAAELAQIRKETVPEGCTPMHPTADSETVTLFAEALLFVCK